MLGERVFSVPAGFRLRSVNNAVIVDIITAASAKDGLISGPSQDLHSSWKIKAVNEVEADEQINIRKSLSSKDKILSKNSVQNVLDYKSRKQDQFVVKDSLDVLFHEVSTMK